MLFLLSGSSEDEGCNAYALPRMTHGTRDRDKKGMTSLQMHGRFRGLGSGSECLRKSPRKALLVFPGPVSALIAHSRADRLFPDRFHGPTSLVLFSTSSHLSFSSTRPARVLVHIMMGTARPSHLPENYCSTISNSLC